MTMRGSLMPGGCSTCPGVVAVPVLTHTRGSETHGAGESGVLGPQMPWYGAASRCVTGHPAAALRCRGQTAQHRAAHLRSRGAGVGTPLPYAAGGEQTETVGGFGNIWSQGHVRDWERCSPGHPSVYMH